MFPGLLDLLALAFFCSTLFALLQLLPYSCEGRPLLPADVSTLQREIASLYDELNRIEYDEDHTESEQIKSKRVSFPSEEILL